LEIVDVFAIFFLSLKKFQKKLILCWRVVSKIPKFRVKSRKYHDFKRTGEISWATYR